MTDDLNRLANLLTAAAVSSAGRISAAAAAAAGTSTSGAAALITLRTDPGLGITELGRRVGLSQPAAARMVDSLVGQGLVDRHRGSSRSARLVLTRRGRAVAAKALQARHSALKPFLDNLAPAQRDTLRTALEALLPHVYAELGSEHLVCRLCDRGACVAGTATCPVGQAARDQRTSQGGQT